MSHGESPPAASSANRAEPDDLAPEIGSSAKRDDLDKRFEVASVASSGDVPNRDIEDGVGGLSGKQLRHRVEASVKLATYQPRRAIDPGPNQVSFKQLDKPLDQQNPISKILNCTHLSHVQMLEVMVVLQGWEITRRCAEDGVGHYQ